MGCWPVSVMAECREGPEFAPPVGGGHSEGPCCLVIHGTGVETARLGLSLSLCGGGLPSLSLSPQPKEGSAPALWLLGAKVGSYLGPGLLEAT